MTRSAHVARPSPLNVDRRATVKPFLILAVALLAALPAGARDVHCQRTAIDASCDDGTRITRTATGTRIDRPGEKPLRCARTPTGEVCRHD